MTLPYASEEIVRIATEAIEGACFNRDATDQFLTMCAMDWMSDYDGESDFGSLTRIDLDDELRVVLSLVDMISLERTDELSLHNVTSHYVSNDVMLGWGGSQKWWADWYPTTTEEADAAQERFANEYSEYLGDDEN